MTINITDTAASYVYNQITERGRGLGIRVGVKPSGCTGLSYILEFVDQVFPEDLVFDYGSKGIKQALDGIKRSAEEPAKVNTIKWDGKPAIIFGRDDSGQFILTDKGGFVAQGYNGMATSAKDMARVFSNRKGDYSDLILIYQKLFSLLRNTVPQHFK